MSHVTVDLHTITSLKRATLAGRVEARVHAQIDALTRKETREGKPFFEIIVADAEARLTLRAWSDAPAFSVCEGLAPGAFLEVGGEFSSGASYGLEAKRWTCRELTADERAALLGGPAARRERQAMDFALIKETASNLGDPRLHALAQTFLDEYGDRFRRAAAARNNHH